MRVRTSSKARCTPASAVRPESIASRTRSMPAAIVDEHAEGLEDLALLARLHVVGLEQAIDILAHAGERFVEARLLLAPRPRRRRAG